MKKIFIDKGDVKEKKKKKIAESNNTRGIDSRSK